jgi:hypothetical protein
MGQFQHHIQGIVLMLGSIEGYAPCRETGIYFALFFMSGGDIPRGLNASHTSHLDHG